MRSYGGDLLSAEEFQKLFNEFDKRVIKEVTEPPAWGQATRGERGSLRCVLALITRVTLGVSARDSGPEDGEREQRLLGSWKPRRFC